MVEKMPKTLWIWVGITMCGSLLNAALPPQVQELFNAVRDDDRKRTQEAVDKLGDGEINMPSTGRSKSTALMIACARGKHKIARLLLGSGADMHAKDRYGRTALERAIRSRKDRCCLLLLEWGFNLSQLSSDIKNGLLLLIAQRGKPELIARVLESGADVDARGVDGRTALHRAAEGGREQTMGVLLDNGVDAFARDTFGRTAMHYAAESNSVACMRLLYWCCSTQEREKILEVPDNNGKTPLHHAVRQDALETGRYLIEHGVRVDTVGKTVAMPLELAVGYRRSEFARMLVDAGADSTRKVKVLCTKIRKDGGQIVVCKKKSLLEVARGRGIDLS